MFILINETKKCSMLNKWRISLNHICKIIYIYIALILNVKCKRSSLWLYQWKNIVFCGMKFRENEIHFFLSIFAVILFLRFASDKLEDNVATRHWYLFCDQKNIECIYLHEVYM